MLNHYVRLFLFYYYYSCYVFYYIVWLSLTLFGNVVNKEEILLLTTFAINWKPSFSLILIIVQTAFIDQFCMFQNHHVLPVRTSRECLLLFCCFPFHFIIPQPWFHFCDLHVFGIQLHQTQGRQTGPWMNESSNMKKDPAIVYFETHLLKKRFHNFSFT